MYSLKTAFDVEITLGICDSISDNDDPFKQANKIDSVMATFRQTGFMPSLIRS